MGVISTRSRPVPSRREDRLLALRTEFSCRIISSCFGRESTMDQEWGMEIRDLESTTMKPGSSIVFASFCALALCFSLLIFTIQTVCAAFISGSGKPCLMTDFSRDHPAHPQTDRQTNKQNRAANYSLKTRSFARLTLSISLPFCIDRSSHRRQPGYCGAWLKDKTVLGFSLTAGERSSLSRQSPSSWPYDSTKLGGQKFRAGHGWRRRVSFHD